MSEQQKLIESKTENSELVAPAPNNPHNEIKAIFDPPTELPIACLEASERSFVKDRRWVGLRTAEIVKRKFGGYDKVTNEQLSLATRQAWDERVAVCQSLTAKAEPVSGNPEPTKNTVEKAI